MNRLAFIFAVSYFWLAPSPTAVASSAPVPGGYPNRGTLQGAISLAPLIHEHGRELRSVSPPEFQYGTQQMARLLVDIGQWGEASQKQPVWIGDISLKRGGQLARHLTHQRGLDADIAYLVREHKVTGQRAKRFHDRFTEQFGVSPKQGLGKNFDLAANYRLFTQVIAHHEVDAIFVGCAIFDALEAYDRTQSASILSKIYAEKGHEDHFHVRIKCPAGLAGCSDDWWMDPAKKPRPRKERAEPVRDSVGKIKHC